MDDNSRRAGENEPAPPAKHPTYPSGQPYGYAPPPGWYPPPPPRKGIHPAVWITCCLLSIIPAMGILATIAIPILLSARVNAVNEKARNSLRAVVSAEAAYFAAHGKYGSASELVQGNYLDSSFASGDVGHGIAVTIEAAPDKKSFKARAETPGSHPPQHDYTATESGMINEE